MKLMEPRKPDEKESLSKLQKVDSAREAITYYNPEEREADRAADAVYRGKAAETIGAVRDRERGPAPEFAPSGAGEELAPSARRHFERRFGEEFGGIRVHVGASAAASAA